MDGVCSVHCLLPLCRGATGDLAPTRLQPVQLGSSERRHGCTAGSDFSSVLHHHCTPPSLLAPCLQLLFLAGVALTIGFQATLKFFIKKKNYKVRRPARWALAYSLPVAGQAE